MAEGLTHIAIGARQTRIASGVQPAWVLDVGTQALTPGPFRHEPPSALEIEQAIEHVENAVMPLLRQLPAGARLATADAQAHALQRMLAPDAWEGAVLSIEAVEQAFNEVAAVAQGRPAVSAGALARAEVAAYVLILREAMHHLGFDAVALQAEAPS